MFSAKLSINISDIQELKLSDGTKVFENGILIETEEQLRKYIKMGNMKENSKYIINCCILILILGFELINFFLILSQYIFNLDKPCVGAPTNSAFIKALAEVSA